MTDLIVKMSMSLDGFVARADGSNDWIFPSYSDDAVGWTVNVLACASAHLVGSTTYRGMAAHWPTDTSPFAAPMNAIPKIVFSSTMRESIWGDTTFLDGDLAEEIERLKATSADGYLLAHGGSQFVQSLCRTGLVDEFRILVHPVALGDGKPLFPTEVAFDSARAVAFTSGAVAHLGRPKASHAAA